MIEGLVRQDFKSIGVSTVTQTNTPRSANIACLVLVAVGLATVGCSAERLADRDAFISQLHDSRTLVDEIDELQHRAVSPSDSIDSVAELKELADRISKTVGDLSLPDTTQKFPACSLVESAGNLNFHVEQLRAEGAAAHLKCLRIRACLDELEGQALGIHWRTETVQIVDRTLQLLGLLLGWPGILITLIAIASLSQRVRHLLASAFRGVRSLKLFGNELILSEQTRTAVSQEVSSDFAAYRKTVEAERIRLVAALDIESLLARVFDDINNLENDLHGDVRCTVHIADVVFDNSICQLLEYYPRRPTYGRDAGRCWTIRFGVIGLTWRTGKPQHAGSDDVSDADKLVREWGMTMDEVTTWAQGRKSLCAFPILTPEGSVAGVFYIDHAEANKILPIHQEKAAGACEQHGLTAAVIEAAGELRRIGPFIKVFG